MPARNAAHPRPISKYIPSVPPCLTEPQTPVWGFEDMANASSLLLYRAKQKASARTSWIWSRCWDKGGANGRIRGDATSTQHRSAARISIRLLAFHHPPYLPSTLGWHLCVHFTMTEARKILFNTWRRSGQTEKHFSAAHRDFHDRWSNKYSRVYFISISSCLFFHSVSLSLFLFFFFKTDFYSKQ